MIRGDIWLADFGIPFGSEPGFQRPVLIIQDDNFNKSKIHTTVVLPFTTNVSLTDAPGNVFVETDYTGLSKDSVIVVSQIYAIDKHRLIKKISKLNKSVFYEIEEGIKLVLGIE